jgi:hypothetical protein
VFYLLFLVIEMLPQAGQAVGIGSVFIGDEDQGVKRVLIGVSPGAMAFLGPYTGSRLELIVLVSRMSQKNEGKAMISSRSHFLFFTDLADRN